MMQISLKKFARLLVGLSLLGSIQCASESYNKLQKVGLPSDDEIRVFEDFVLAYDERLKAPAWVMEFLRPQKLAKTIDQMQMFEADKQIESDFRVTNGDFEFTELEPGQMAAALNHADNEPARRQTYLLSNTAPMQPGFKAGAWAKLEAYIQWAVETFAKEAYLISGPLYLPHKDAHGNLEVEYPVIGRNNVGVPTHFFKVLLIRTPNKRYELEAFKLPNDEALDSSVNLDDFRVSLNDLDQIENPSGLSFFSRLSKSKLKPVDSRPGFEDQYKEILLESVPASVSKDKVRSSPRRRSSRGG